jgi:hypothetical protein
LPTAGGLAKEIALEYFSFFLVAFDVIHAHAFQKHFSGTDAYKLVCITDIILEHRRCHLELKVFYTDKVIIRKGRPWFIRYGGCIEFDLEFWENIIILTFT